MSSILFNEHINPLLGPAGNIFPGPALGCPGELWVPTLCDHLDLLLGEVPALSEDRCKLLLAHHSVIVGINPIKIDLCLPQAGHHPTVQNYYTYTHTGSK